MKGNSRKLVEKLYGKQYQVDSAEIAPLLHQFGEPLPDLDSPAFAALFDRYADARVVMLGEASHGTMDTSACWPSSAAWSSEAWTSTACATPFMRSSWAWAD